MSLDPIRELDWLTDYVTRKERARLRERLLADDCIEAAAGKLRLPGPWDGIPLLPGEFRTRVAREAITAALDKAAEQ